MSYFGFLFTRLFLCLCHVSWVTSTPRFRIIGVVRVIVRFVGIVVGKLGLVLWMGLLVSWLGNLYLFELLKLKLSE